MTLKAILLLCLLLASFSAAPGAAADPAALERGAYLFALAGCAGCHTEGPAGALGAGGRALKTPFGTFYGPNITPDPEHGLGKWSDEDFRNALRQGVAPDGSNLFPAFPYTSFTKLTDSDIADLQAYVFSLPPVPLPDRAHDLSFPFSWRFGLTFWKWLNFSPGPFVPEPARDAQWNRGAYLVEAVLHCGECHTARDSTGGLDAARAFAGTTAGPEGKKVPNITPDPDTGIGQWDDGQVLALLKIGLLPDGDVVGSLMGEVVQRSTSKLTDADRRSVVAYLRGLAPIANPKAKATAPGWE